MSAFCYLILRSSLSYFTSGRRTGKITASWSARFAESCPPKRALSNLWIDSFAVHSYRCHRIWHAVDFRSLHPKYKKSISVRHSVILVLVLHVLHLQVLLFLLPESYENVKYKIFFLFSDWFSHRCSSSSVHFRLNSCTSDRGHRTGWRFSCSNLEKAHQMGNILLEEKCQTYRLSWRSWSWSFRWYSMDFAGWW